MSDLIRRDEVLQALAGFEVPEDPDGSVYIAWGIGTAMRLTENVAAVDAVEVVRCRDCRFSKPAANNDYIVCEIMECYCGLMKDDFCVCGKRREENAVD